MTSVGKGQCKGQHNGALAIYRPIRRPNQAAPHITGNSCKLGVVLLISEVIPHAVASFGLSGQHSTKALTNERLHSQEVCKTGSSGSFWLPTRGGVSAGK